MLTYLGTAVDAGLDSMCTLPATISEGVSRQLKCAPNTCLELDIVLTVGRQTQLPGIPHPEPFRIPLAYKPTQAAAFFKRPNYS